MKKTDADLIWEALLNEARTGTINKATLDSARHQREYFDMELSDEEKAVLDNVIQYLSKELEPQDHYKKANKLSSILNYVKRRMQRN